MSRIRIYRDSEPQHVLKETQQHSEIAAELRNAGVRFEKWNTEAPVTPGAAQDEVLVAYRRDIDRLKNEGGYQAADVISLKPDHPDKTTLRQKFLNEHTHSEDEVRFFVAGAGLFSLRIGGRVYEVLCQQGDLISVPAGTRHWFDMGPNPSFVAIRLFTNPAGWVANFTGDTIAERFPRHMN